jgi:hypothetical protein
MAQAVWKLKKSKRDENDILGFDFKIEWACGVGSDSGLERITCSIAIKRLRLLTQPGPKAPVPECLLSRRFWGVGGRSSKGLVCFYEHTPWPRAYGPGATRKARGLHRPGTMRRAAQ